MKPNFTEIEEILNIDPFDFVSVAADLGAFVFIIYWERVKAGVEISLTIS